MPPRPLKIEDGRVAAIVSQSDIPAGASVRRFDDGMIAPGFVDLQVNGGGGVMLNDDPSVEAIETNLRGAPTVWHNFASPDAHHRHARENQSGHRGGD